VSLRRYHEHEPGYVEERLNYYVANDRIVIYLAAERGICSDVKYVVVCKAHGAEAACAWLAEAKNLARHPYAFCEKCRELRNAKVKSSRRGGFRKLKTYHPPERRPGYEGSANT